MRQFCMLIFAPLSAFLLKTMLINALLNHLFFLSFLKDEQKGIRIQFRIRIRISHKAVIFLPKLFFIPAFLLRTGKTGTPIVVNH